MRKDRVLDMLDNAEDKIVDRLSVPALTEKEKERLLKMSKDKLDKMNDNNTDDMTEEVRGVEKYRRPGWSTFAAIAAAVVLVGGLAGGGVLLSRHSSNSKGNDESVIDPVIATQPVTETATEAASIASTEASTAKTENTTVAAAASPVESTAAAVGSNEEDNRDHSVVAVDLMKAMNAIELASSGGLTIDGNSPLASESGYYKVIDGNINGFDFSTMANVRSFLTDNFSGSFYDEHSYLTEGSESFFKEGPDGLYARFAGRGNIYSWDKYEPEIISDSEDRFIARAYYEIAGSVTQVDMTIVKNGGKWRVDSAVREDVTGSDQNETENNNSVSYVQLCKDLVNNKWNELNSTEGNAYADVAFNDLDGDGSPEFLFKYGTGEVNYKVDVYTFKDGSLKYVADIHGGHASFGIDASTKKLVMINGHMGAGEYDWYTMENGELKMLKYESFSYEYWGSNEQTTRKDILYMSSGTMFTVGDGNAKSYLYTQSPIDQQPVSTEYDYYNTEIIDLTYAEALKSGRIPEGD